MPQFKEGDHIYGISEESDWWTNGRLLDGIIWAVHSDKKAVLAVIYEHEDPVMVGMTLPINLCDEKGQPLFAHLTERVILDRQKEKRRALDRRFGVGSDPSKPAQKRPWLVPSYE